MQGFADPRPSKSARIPAYMESARARLSTGQETSVAEDPSRDFESILGGAVLKLWAELPRDVQELLFESAAIDPAHRKRLAVYLHERHPRTAYPPKP